MPPISFALLSYLMEFAACVVSHKGVETQYMVDTNSYSEVTKMTPVSLAIVLGPNIFRYYHKVFLVLC
jgi:hypothetical protein